MKVAENGEILVSGPNIFPGYWKRPEETTKAMERGWYHTGDQGEVDAKGNWRITGRLKNLIVLNSGHNVAPEPLENLSPHLPDAQQVVLLAISAVFLAALVMASSNGPIRERSHDSNRSANAGLPHYK